MLVARVAVQRPDVVIVDADSHGALDVVARMRELPQADDVHVVFVAAPGSAVASLDEAHAHDGSALSIRPVDVAALARDIEALCNRAGPGAPPPSVPPAAPVSPALPLSAELQRMLAEAEQRVALLPSDEGAPSPEQEIEALLPADLLCALDEPIDDEEDPEPPVRMRNVAPALPAFAAARERTTDGGTTRTTGASTDEGLTPRYGEALRVVCGAVTSRTSGSLCVLDEPRTAKAIERRVVLHEGDVVTCASPAEDESLVAFLGARGDLPRETVRRLGTRLPAFGRHAGAALVARGYLLQDQMWPTLREHAEWVLGRVLSAARVRVDVEPEPPSRLAGEPSVFGGAPGASVVVDVVRRVVAPSEALDRLGGSASRLGRGASGDLLGECGLTSAELRAVHEAMSAAQTVGDVLEAAGDPDFASALLALNQLGITDVLRANGRTSDGDSPDPDAAAIEAQAVRERVRARLQLVEDGDYFAVLGIARDATGYEVKRAFLELRRSFDPARPLSPELSDLSGDVRKIAAVLEEAFEILKDGARRERYRRAIEGAPPPPT